MRCLSELLLFVLLFGATPANSIGVDSIPTEDLEKFDPHVECASLATMAQNGLRSIHVLKLLEAIYETDNSKFTEFKGDVGIGLIAGELVGIYITLLTVSVEEVAEEVIRQHFKEEYVERGCRELL